jgi:hypothetical protein
LACLVQAEGVLAHKQGQCSLHLQHSKAVANAHTMAATKGQERVCTRYLGSKQMKCVSKKMQCMGCTSRNRSGSNLSGSGQCSGSWWSWYTATRHVALAGIVASPIYERNRVATTEPRTRLVERTVVDVNNARPNTGATGYRRSDSFSTISTYLSITVQSLYHTSRQTCSHTQARARGPT